MSNLPVKLLYVIKDDKGSILVTCANKVRAQEIASILEASYNRKFGLTVEIVDTEQLEVK